MPRSPFSCELQSISSALPGVPSDHGGAPTYAKPNAPQDGVDDPSAPETTHSAHRPSAGSRQSIHNHGRAVADDAQPPAAVVRFARQLAHTTPQVKR
jgi:hypothetical protein